jgi:hypothetical protein
MSKSTNWFPNSKDCVLAIDASFERLSPIPEKPGKFDEMVLICRRLSKDATFVRVDLYEADGKLFFSELTLTPHGGYYPFNPQKWNTIFGSWLKLPEK